MSKLDGKSVSRNDSVEFCLCIMKGFGIGVLNAYSVFTLKDVILAGATNSITINVLNL